MVPLFDVELPLPAAFSCVVVGKGDFWLLSTLSETSAPGVVAGWDMIEQGGLHLDRQQEERTEKPWFGEHP